MKPGRSCPLDYRYSPAVFRRNADVQTETLYVVGGLYGNEAALDRVLEIYSLEKGRKHLIFNGDFNWFNSEADCFRRINETVLEFDAIRGNVEAELARQRHENDLAGCGCAYPDWVEEGVVERSNAIMLRLAQTAANFPDVRARLAALPSHRRIDVGGLPVAVVHGDATSLAGWGFAPEHLMEEEHLNQVKQWFDQAGVRLFACSHTCSPIFKPLTNTANELCLVANNGAAGMPNFADPECGLMTRIASSSCSHEFSMYGTRVGGLYVDAIAIPYDSHRWQAEFLAQWPPGSPAYESYWSRIAGRLAYTPKQAYGSVAAVL